METTNEPTTTVGVRRLKEIIWQAFHYAGNYKRHQAILTSDNSKEKDDVLEYS